MLSDMATAPRAAPRRAPWLGLVVAVLLVAAAIALPQLLDWDTATRRDDEAQFPPLHGYWMPKVAWVSLLTLAIAGLGWRYAESVATRLSWRGLLLTAYAVGLAWLLALAFVDGEDGITRVLGNPYEYLETARDTDDVGRLLDTFVDRIPYDAEDNWVTHVAGHPPGALLFFVGLVRLGLGGDLQAGLVVIAIAASIAPAVLVAVRALGAEEIARKAAPFLVLSPAAVFLAVSADAMFAAVAAWGLAALALAATAPVRWRTVAWSVLAGLLLGYCVLLSYGLPLLGLLAIAVLLSARSWLPLPIAAAAALRRRARLRRGRLRLVGRLPGARRPLSRRRRRRPPLLLLGLGQPGRAAALGGTTPRGRSRPPRRDRPTGGSHHRAARLRCRSRPSSSPTCPACRSRRSSGSGCPSSPGSCCRSRCSPTAGAGGASACSSLTALLLQHLLYTSWWRLRHAAVRWRTRAALTSGVTCAVNPSSRRASSGEATMCRTSPRRYPPVT